MHKSCVHAFACYGRPLIEGMLDDIDPSSTHGKGQNGDDKRDGSAMHDLRALCGTEETKGSIGSALSTVSGNMLTIASISD